MKQVVHILNQVKLLQGWRCCKTLGKKVVAFWSAHLTYTHNDIQFIEFFNNGYNVTIVRNLHI